MWQPDTLPSAYTSAAMIRPKANEMPSRSAPVMAGFESPASTSVATTDPGPTRTSRAVPSVSAKARCCSEYSITPPEFRSAFDNVERNSATVVRVGPFVNPGSTHGRVGSREAACDPRMRMSTRTQTPAERTAEMRRQLPDSPGVYLFKDRRARVLYVGKASSVRKRVGSHFSKPATRGAYEMLDQIETIDFVATETEAEALLAEQNFIRRHRPRYNIRLRDDKSYPYIGISLDEDFPRVYFTREKHRRGRAYFGPYSNAKRTRETLDLLGKVFQFRTCDGAEPGRASGSPCLDYFIKRCQAPCVGYISREDYRENIENIIRFLSGRYRQIERDLEAAMYDASEHEEYELAANLRNRLKAVQSLLERQRISNEAVGTIDVIAVAAEGTDANAQV